MVSFGRGTPLTLLEKSSPSVILPRVAGVLLDRCDPSDLYQGMPEVGPPMWESMGLKMLLAFEKASIPAVTSQ